MDETKMTKKEIRKGILIVLLALTVVYWSAIWAFINKLNLTLLKDYLAVLISWPLAIFIISLIFIFKFSESISEFLKHAKFKYKDYEVFAQPKQENVVVAEEIKTDIPTTEIEKIKESLEEKDNKLNNNESLINFLVERVEMFEFAYLNLLLVFNSKNALLWLYLNNGSTKGNFLNNYVLPPQVSNQVAEKEAVFDVLLRTELIARYNDVYSVTEKGVRFLKHLGMI